MPGSGLNISLRIKGGPGSGHHGHVGRPGKRGGSLPGKRGNYSISFGHFGQHELSDMEDVFGGMTEDHIANMFALEDTYTQIVVREDTFNEGHYKVSATYYGDEGRRHLGSAKREFYIDDDGKRVCDNDYLKFSATYQNRGAAKELYRRQIETLRTEGFDRIELQADISIGRYAWAKQGFKYKYPDKANPVDGLDEWLKVNFGDFGGGLTSDERRALGSNPTPFDIATFSRGSDINPAAYSDRLYLPDAVPRGMKMHLGKAFMLDRSIFGHGSWSAVLNLQE